MEYETHGNSIRQNESGLQIAGDILCLPVLMVNVCIIGKPEGWVLIDTGVGNSEGKILQAVQERLGRESLPKAIILTHGHFDHIGAVSGLAERWNTDVYAHELEMPYLTGKADYPPPDPSVGGGLMARISPVYPNNGINLGDRVKPLPKDGSLPFMEGWRWIHTPGHTAGHISLFRDSDRVLVAGDALTTVKQESAMAVLTQRKEINGPPAYFTTDWKAAWESVKRLKSLNPQVVISSHGQPLSGEKLGKELEELANNFDRVTIPDHGRYVH